jgi:hypothetical protein
VSGSRCAARRAGSKAAVKIGRDDESSSLEGTEDMHFVTCTAARRRPAAEERTSEDGLDVLEEDIEGSKEGIDRERAQASVHLPFTRW